MNRDEYSLFKSNPEYTVHRFETKEEWAKNRNLIRGIGGSDSAAAMGLSPWKTNVDLWRIKTGREEPEDISNNPAVAYGTNAEESIRRMFQLDYATKYNVEYVPNTILESNRYPHMLYSPDGLLEELGTMRTGVFEAKTSTIHGNGNQWKDRIPQNYYIQVLHGMAVTNSQFAVLRAWLRYSDEYVAVRTYHIERNEQVEEDIEYILKKVAEFWEYVEADKEPPLIIGGLI